MHLRFGILLVLAGGCGLDSGDRPAVLAPGVLQDVAGLVAAAVDEQQPPGASLVVMRGDAIVLERGYGLESIERTDPVTPTTVFELGSISKQFTAALVLKLEEEGRLSLDDSAAKHLPDFTSLSPDLTIRHLLTHTSGMREIFSQPELVALFEIPGSSAEQLEAVARQAPADFAPGERWSYSNMNYLMLTFIAERATGQGLEDALSVHFFRPLALSSMRACESRPGGARGAARGHLRTATGLVPHPPENFHLFIGAGGLCANAVDLARWMQALATGKVLTPSSYAQMTAPARLTGGRMADYGMGMVLVSPDGTRRLGHGGYGGGFSSQAAYYPERETTVVLMLNRFVFPEYVERRIARRLHGIPEATMSEVAITADERKRYAGTYDIGVSGSDSAVVERDGKLWFENRPLPPQPLTYVGNGEFVREGQPYGYRLYFGPDNPERALRILGMGMMTWYGRRRP